MADIPLFPAGNIGLPLQGASPFPVENLDPRLYGQGLRDAQLDPSAFTSAVSGLKEGLGFASDLESASARNDLLRSKALEARSEAAFAPEKIELERRQAEAQLKAAETVNLTADIKHKQAEQAQDLFNQSLKKQKIVQDSFATVRAGNLEQGIGELEDNFLDVAQVGLPYSNDDKGNKLAPDASVVAGLDDVIYRAQKTKDPELISRAQGLKDRFNSIANTQSNALAGRSIGGSVALSGSGDSEKDFLKGQGISIADEVAQAGQAVSQPSQETPVGAPVQKGPPNILFPESVGEQPGFVQGKDEFAGTPKEKQPLSRQVALQGEEKIFAEDIDRRKKELQDADPTLTGKQALDQATKEAKANQLTDKRQQYIDSLGSNAANFRQTAMRGQLALERLQKLKKEHPEMELALGPTHSWEQGVNWLRGRLGDPKSRELLDNIKSDLSAVSNSGIFDLAKEYGFGTRAFDTAREQELIKSIQVPENATIERYISAMQLLGSKAEEAEQMRAVIDVYRRRGYTFEAAKAAADSYRLGNPSTVEGQINDKSFLLHNPNKQNVYQWMDERLGWGKYIDRGPDGRVTNAPPAQTSSVLKKMSGKAEPVDHLSVAEYQPEGVTEATLMRLAAVESSGRVGVEGPPTKYGTAKGLFQFLDKTGEEEWKKAGFEGEYNPKDPEKATIMMKSRMDRLLKVFHGDIRLALAANNAGEGNILGIIEARNKAGEKQNDTSWDVVKHYLPKPEETIPYVEKIMGDREGLPGLREFTPTEMHTVLAGLPTTKGQQNARAFLSPDGMATLASAKDVKSAGEIAGTWMEEPLNFLLSMGATEAQAEEPGKSSEAKPAPSESNEQNMVQRGITSAADAIRSVIPEGLQSTVLGLARSAMWGLDDEAGAVVRHMVLGEPMDQAYENARAQKQAYQEKNPWLYTTGEVIGALPAGGLATRGAAKIFGAEAVKNLGVKGLTAMGAGTGAAMGFTEGEGGFENRALNAVRGGVGGAVMGVATKPVIAGATAIVKPFASVISKLYGKYKNQPNSQTFTTGQKEILARLGNISEQETAKVSSDLQQGGPTLSALDVLPPSKLRQFVEMAAKDPDVTDDLLREAKERNNTIPQAVDNLLGKHADITLTPAETFEHVAQAAEKRAGGIEAIVKQAADQQTQSRQGAAKQFLDTQRGRVDQVLNQFTNPVRPEEAFRRVAKSAEDRIKNLTDLRKQLANPAYKDAEESLPLIKTKYKKAQAATTVPSEEDVFLVDPQGRAVSSEGELVQRSVRGENLPQKVPGFVGKEIQEAISDPVVGQKVKEIANDPRINPNGLYPESSFRVLQAAKISLYHDAETLGGIAGHNAGQALGKLRAAMHNESDAYKNADVLYETGSEAIRKANTKLVQTFRKLSDPENVTNINKIGDILTGADPDTLGALISSSSPAEQQHFRDAVRGYITNQLDNQGERFEGSKQAFTNFTKNLFPQKVKAIFGDQAGAQINAALRTEYAQTQTANKKLFESVKPPTPQIPKTIQRLRKLASRETGGDINEIGKILFKQDPKELKAVAKDFGADGEQLLKNAMVGHLRNTIDFRGEGSEVGAKILTDFTKNDIPRKLTAVFGKDASKEIIDGLKQYRRMSETDSLILTQGAQTAQRAAESVKAARGRASSQIAQAFGALGVGAVSGNPYGMAGSASFAVYKTTQALRSYLESAQVANKVKMADEISNILVRDKGEAIKLFDKITTHLKAQKQNDALKLWNSAVSLAKKKAGTVATIGGQGIGGYGEDYKPDTQKAARATDVGVITPSR